MSWASAEDIYLSTSLANYLDSMLLLYRFFCFVCQINRKLEINARFSLFEVHCYWIRVFCYFVNVVFGS